MFTILGWIFPSIVGDATQKNVKLNFKITPEAIQLLIRYTSELMDRATVQRVHLIFEALKEQAERNLPLFQENWNHLLKEEKVFFLLKEKTVPHLFQLAQRQAPVYNPFIIQFIQANLSDIEFKKTCIIDALRSQNNHLALWLLTVPNGWAIGTPFFGDYPILLHLADRLEKELMNTLLSLKTPEGEPVVKMEDLNYEVTPKNAKKTEKHTALERVLGIYFHVGMAELLRRQGATNFGSLDPQLRQNFLDKETALKKNNEQKDTESIEEVGYCMVGTVKKLEL